MAHVHVANMSLPCPFHCLGMYRITREEKITTPAIIQKSITALRIIKTKNVVYILNYFLFRFFISHFVYNSVFTIKCMSLIGN